MELERIRGVVDILGQIEEDFTVPKNIRIKIKGVVESLNQETLSIDIRIDIGLQELDEISDDPNLSSFTRMQIWNVLSALESI
ncbi:UPF0147 family protein [Candidatus Woesearchaeota archaeon]|nr:hypothetical protein [uncultured archaeon]MBS3149374.1 UPF0147 family protein [Candidatus Woesearchaeota archaeon]